MLKVGDKAPDFTLPSHLRTSITLSQFRGKKTIVLAFYPLNWTPVCSGQIPGYHEVLDRFEALNTQVLAVSVDSIPSHKSWAYSMGGIDYPLLSDFWPHGEIATRYGVMTDAGHTERAIFVIDTEGIIRYIDHHDIAHEPDIEELFRILTDFHKG
ncbi:MAG: peroxiredoxin [FCB group bacterium]|nr:peroxiredoxin [FCB group bacterium]